MNKKTWSIFSKESIDSDIHSVKIADIWWLRHEPDCGILVLYNITKSILKEIQLKLYNEENKYWLLPIGDIDYGVASEVPFVELLKKSGKAFQGKLVRVTVGSFENLQHFMAQDDRFISMPPEKD